MHGYINFAKTVNVRLVLKKNSAFECNGDLIVFHSMLAVSTNSVLSVSLFKSEHRAGCQNLKHSNLISDFVNIRNLHITVL